MKHWPSVSFCVDEKTIIECDERDGDFLLRLRPKGMTTSPIIIRITHQEVMSKLILALANANKLIEKRNPYPSKKGRPKSGD